MGSPEYNRAARGSLMTPENAIPNAPTAPPVAGAASSKAKVRHKANIRFPYQAHCSITPSMKESIERMAYKLCLSEADIHRMALIFYLTQNDAQYAHEN